MFIMLGWFTCIADKSGKRLFMYRINVGCGMSPTPGWLNYDNSIALKLAKYKILCGLFGKMRIFNNQQIEYIRFCQENSISWANVTRKIPLPDGSVDVLYSSHMLEHLDRAEALKFISESKRVLKKGGVIRLALPDLKIAIRDYIETEDADAFVEKIYMGLDRPKTLMDRLKLLIIGTRHHHWMYDGKSISALLKCNGFSLTTILPAGETTIVDYEPLNLREYEGWSVYVEAKKD